MGSEVDCSKDMNTVIGYEEDIPEYTACRKRRVRLAWMSVDGVVPNSGFDVPPLDRRLGCFGVASRVNNNMMELVGAMFRVPAVSGLGPLSRAPNRPVLGPYSLSLPVARRPGWLAGAGVYGARPLVDDDGSVTGVGGGYSPTSQGFRGAGCSKASRGGDAAGRVGEG
jgi:hypothetical protein